MGKNGKAPHSAWCNYDDLNEYFWFVSSRSPILPGFCCLIEDSYLLPMLQVSWLFLSGLAHAGWWRFFQIHTWLKTGIYAVYSSMSLQKKTWRCAVTAQLYILCQGRKGTKRNPGSTGKSNFVETRTFWNIFRSFDRLWTFYILALQVCRYLQIWCLTWFIIDKQSFLLQAMIIIAWSGVSILEIFQKKILYELSSIFITAAILRLLQSMLLLQHKS